MPDLLPNTEALAERAAKAVMRGESVYVEGPVGAGRTSLVEALRCHAPDQAAVVELLPISEADAAGVALLEAASHLAEVDAPKWETGSERELHTLAQQIGDRLRDSGKFLILRIPDSWQEAEFSPRTGDVLPLRARSVLSGFLVSGVSLIVVADAALTPSHFGYHPAQRFQLPRHVVPARSLEHASWGDYRDAFERVCSITTSLTASPLAWRLAIGCVALGAATKAVLERLAVAIPLPPLSALMAKCIRRSIDVALPLMRFLAVRRPLQREAVAALTKISDAHLPLLTECIGYGDHLTRVSPVVRGLLSRGKQSDTTVSSDDHQTLASHYADSDGAASPTGLPPVELRAWSERVHHLALCANDTNVGWDALDLPAPSFYWDRGRFLSVTKRDFGAAARVYKQCVSQFPEDDYSWHYWAFNLHRARGATRDVDRGYRKAIELNVENPWWNRRLVEFLIREGALEAARDEWRLALDRVDPDGTQVRRSPWLAYNFHLGVCRAWMSTGRHRAASSVLGLVPRQLRKRGALAFLERRVEKGLGSWDRYLRKLNEDALVGQQLARHVRWWWETLSETVQLPPPLAELTADEERFQLAWSYDAVLLELEIRRDGTMEWFAKNRQSDVAADGELERHGSLGADLTGWLERISDA